MATATFFFDIGLFLSEYLKQIKKDLENQNVENFNLRSFEALIAKHIEVYDYFERVNKLFAPIIFTKFFFIAMFICTLGFQMTEVIPEIPSLKQFYEIF